MAILLSIGMIQYALTKKELIPVKNFMKNFHNLSNFLKMLRLHSRGINLKEKREWKGGELL